MSKNTIEPKQDIVKLGQVYLCMREENLRFTYMIQSRSNIQGKCVQLNIEKKRDGSNFGSWSGNQRSKTWEPGTDNP